MLCEVDKLSGSCSDFRADFVNPTNQVELIRKELKSFPISVWVLGAKNFVSYNGFGRFLDLNGADL